MKKDKKHKNDFKRKKKTHPVPSRSERRRKEKLNKERQTKPPKKTVTIEEIKESNRRKKFVELRFFVLLLFFFMIAVFIIAVLTGSGSKSTNKEQSSDEHPSATEEVADTPTHEEVIQKNDTEKFTFGEIDEEFKLFDPLNMTNSFEITPAAFGEGYNRAAISKNLPLIVGFERSYLHYHFTLERNPKNLKEERVDGTNNEQVINRHENDDELHREPTYRMSFREYLATRGEPAHFVFNVNEVDMLDSDEEFFSIALVVLDTITNQEYTKEITEDIQGMKGAELSRDGIWSETRNYGGVNAEFYKNTEIWFLNLSRPSAK